MMRTIYALMATLFSLTAAPVYAQLPAEAWLPLKASVAGPKTRIMVLGSAHLRQLPTSLTSDTLAPLVGGVKRFKPTIIATEVMSGEDCLRIQPYKLKYADVTESYCERQLAVAALATRTTGLDISGALEEIDRRLTAWPAMPAPADRRQLAALFAAAGDYGSALVQWRRLPASERRSDHLLSADLATMLDDLSKDQNEVNMIAVPLAISLNLERLHPSDDHTADSILNGAPEGLTQAVQAIWQTQDSYSAEYRRRIALLSSPEDMLSLFQFLNSVDGQKGVINGEWRSALAQSTPENLGRQYVAWWETRNLRMAANIRASFGNHPGETVLMIVGASHKPYLEQYLGMMHDVEIVDTMTYLD